MVQFAHFNKFYVYIAAIASILLRYRIFLFHNSYSETGKNKPKINKKNRNKP